MAVGGAAVRVQGLRELRRDLRRVAPEVTKELGAANKAGASVVAAASRPLTPHRTGRMAGMTKPGTKGDKGIVRNRHPGANPIHWGWPARNIRESLFLTRALASSAERVVEALGEGLDRAVRGIGFK